MKLGGVNIRRDEAGRYSLNDLHKAAGGEKRHGPSYFMARLETEAIIAELLTYRDSGMSFSYPTNVLMGGVSKGTFVCRELVYAYAMWLSPAFSIKVIRAYDQLATKGIAVHEAHVDRFANDPMKMMEVLGD